MLNMFCLQINDKLSDVNNIAAKNELIGALIGLAKTCESNPYEDDTTELIIYALFTLSTSPNLSSESLKEITKEIHNQKYFVSPNCAFCAAPCGNTDDYDLNILWSLPEDVKSLKSLIIYTLLEMSVYTYNAKQLGYNDSIINEFYIKAF